MSLIKVAPNVLGVTPGVLGDPELRMYPRSGYFLVKNNHIFDNFSNPSISKVKIVRVLDPLISGK